MKIFTLLAIIVTFPAYAETSVKLSDLVGAAAVGSSQAQLIQAAMINKDSGKIRVAGAKSTTLTSKLSRLDSRADNAGGAFAPLRTRRSEVALGAKKLLSTGTVVGSDLSLTDNDTDLPSFGGAANFQPNTEYKEANFSVFVRQSLWKNAFGSSLRSRELAAAKLASSAELDVTGKMETYISSVIEQFYSVWLLQTNYRAADDRLKRQKRLLKVTKVKLNRGTAEETDYLQLQSSVAQVESLMEDIRKNLEDVWRTLVISFGLSDLYLQLDVTKIKLIDTSKIKESETLCRAGRFQESNGIKALRKSIEAAKTEIEALSSDAKPDLYFEARAASNGIDGEVGTSLEESLAYKHPQLSFAIGIDWPLGFYEEKASYLDTFKRQKTAEAQLSQLAATQKIDWMNACKDLERYKAKVRSQQRILNWQKKRNRLEERRFELGQVDLFNVIQSGNDVTTAEVDLKSASSDLDLSAWKVYRLYGNLPEFIKNAVKDLPSERPN